MYVYEIGNKTQWQQIEHKKNISIFYSKVQITTQALIEKKKKSYIKNLFFKYSMAQPHHFLW